MALENNNTPKGVGELATQYGDLLRRFADGSGKLNTEIDGAADVPGRDPFDLVLQNEGFPQRGILIDARIKKGYEGVFKIREYTDGTASIEESGQQQQDEERMGVELDTVRETQVLYENPGYVYKDTPPAERVTFTSYLALGFNDLDESNLSNGRLFITKDPSRWRGRGQSILTRSTSELDPAVGTRRIVRVFDVGDYDGVTGAFKTILSKIIGVNPEDVSTAETLLKNKLAPPPQTTGK